MKRHGLRSFWKSMLGQQAPMEFIGGGAGASVLTVSDFIAPGEISPTITTVVPLPPPLSHSGGASDRERTGATMLFSGIFLGLVGMTFTAMGWLNYDLKHSLEWTQLLGPVLLSVGGAFVLISVCKFRMLSCQSCGCCRDAEELDEPGWITPGQSFVVHGINRPAVFHGTTMAQNIPPSYASVTREGDSANGVPRTLPPQYYTVCPLDNHGFTVDEDSSPSGATDSTGSRLQGRTHQDSGKGSDDDISTTCPPPPAYEDIYPSVD